MLDLHSFMIRQQRLLTGAQTYRVGSGVLLFRGDGGTGSLSSVQRTLSSDDGLAVRSARTANTASNLGGGIPVEVRHDG